MGTIHVKEFRGGLDTRRLPETSAGGTLIVGKDCHITQGGEIEQRAVFELIWSAPSGSSVGLATWDNALAVFGHAIDPPAGLPSNFLYDQLEHPMGEQLLSVPSWVTFGDKVITIGVFSDNAGAERYIFRGETRVDDVNAPPTTGPQPLALGVFAEKLFAGAAQIIYFSAIQNATDFTLTGAGFVDMGFRIPGYGDIKCFAPYEGWLAVFLEDDVAIWSFDADPNESVLIQHLAGIGTFSSRGAVQFRGGDVLFYDKTGIRSLQVRDSSGLAITADIGSPIDSLTRASYQDCPEARRELVSMVVEPLTGRLWISIEDKIYVLSHYQAAKVTAWTVYEPGFIIDAMVTAKGRVYLRSGDNFYVYGSEEGPYQYDATVEAEAWLPYLDANAPATHKDLVGVDVACRGTWEVRVGFDPENLGASDLLARITGTTFGIPPVSTNGGGTHIGLRFRALAPVSETAPAILSSAMIHHSLDDQVDS